MKYFYPFHSSKKRGGDSILLLSRISWAKNTGLVVGMMHCMFEV